MTSLTGTLALTRFILRRDRIRILIWMVALVALVRILLAARTDKE